MSAGTLPAPGTKLGPCLNTLGANGVELTCGHIDCAATRRTAAALCIYCSTPIGFERRFYQEGHGFSHALCEEIRAEAHIAQRTSS